MADRKVLAKVILIGDKGVGKTTLLNFYTNKDMHSKLASGFDVVKKEIRVGGALVSLQLWDTAG